MSGRIVWFLAAAWLVSSAGCVTERVALVCRKVDSSGCVGTHVVQNCEMHDGCRVCTCSGTPATLSMPKE